MKVLSKLEYAYRNLCPCVCCLRWHCIRVHRSSRCQPQRQSHRHTGTRSDRPCRSSFQRYLECKSFVTPSLPERTTQIFTKLHSLFCVHAPNTNCSLQLPAQWTSSFFADHRPISLLCMLLLQTFRTAAAICGPRPFPYNPIPLTTVSNLLSTPLAHINTQINSASLTPPIRMSPSPQMDSRKLLLQQPPSR